MHINNMYYTYMVTKARPHSRSEIRATIATEFGGMADYCLRSQFKYTVVTNLLRGFTPHSRHPEIVAKINADTGADMKAWEK